MLDNRALMFVNVELPSVESRLVQRLRGEGAAVPRWRVAAGETGEAAEAPHRHRHGGARDLSSQERVVSHFEYLSIFFWFTFPGHFHPLLCVCQVCNFRDNGDGRRRKLQVGDEMKSVPSGVFIFEWAISCA